MSLSTLSRGLAGRFQLLTNGARTALPRHQTLSALIDWSYNLLSEAERRTLRRLAAFSGGWTLESALAASSSISPRSSSAQTPGLTCWALCIAAMFASLAGDFEGALVAARDALSRFGGGGRFFVLGAVSAVASVLATRERRRDAAHLVGGCEASEEERFRLRPSYVQALLDRTYAQLRERVPSGELEAWLAEGRSRSYEQTIAAALDIERRPRTSVSKLYG